MDGSGASVTVLTCQRDAFSLPRDVHFLNCAYMSPLPKRVEMAGHAGIDRKRAPHDIRERDFFGDGDHVRQLFARLINAESPSRIAIVPSASYGLGVAMHNTRLAPGQNVIVAGEQFPSNVYGWRRLCAETGGELRTVARPTTVPLAEHWSAGIAGAIDDRTALVAIGAVHWTDGTRFDLQAIGERCRAVGAALVIDGTQSVGALPFDVRAVRPDALVVAAYKWLLGPYGIAVAYYSSRYDEGEPLEEPWIVRQGSDDFRQLVDYQDVYRPHAARYDAGGMANFITVPMVKAALELLHEWTVPAIQAYCVQLIEPVVQAAQQYGWDVEGPAGRAGHLLGVRLPAGTDFKALEHRLRERRVIVAMRGHSIRISPHVYNDEADIAALIQVLAEEIG